MGKAALMTPFYVSVAWTLMVTHQMFTQMAVLTALNLFNVLLPTAAEWLLLRMDMIIFIYAFAWVFVLSSVIPSLLLGKERSVLVQFFVCLTVAFVAFIVQDFVNSHLSSQTQVLHDVASMLGNPLLAVAYLSMPYAVMVGIDIRTRRKHKKDEKIDEINATPLEHSEISEDGIIGEEAMVPNEYS